MLEFRYCPYCGVPLVSREVFGAIRPTCTECGFVQFMDPKVAVIGLVTSMGHVLLIRRGVDPAKGEWALPGGFMDADEMPEEALHRELTEEVGLAVEIDRLLGIYSMAPRERVAGGIVVAYAAGPVDGDLPALACNDDVVEAAWFSSDSLPEQVAFESTRELLTAWRRDRVKTPRE